MASISTRQARGPMIMMNLHQLHQRFLTEAVTPEGSGVGRDAVQLVGLSFGAIALSLQPQGRTVDKFPSLTGAVDQAWRAWQGSDPAAVIVVPVA